MMKNNPKKKKTKNQNQQQQLYSNNRTQKHPHITRHFVVKIKNVEMDLHLTQLWILLWILLSESDTSEMISEISNSMSSLIDILKQTCVRYF